MLSLPKLSAGGGGGPARYPPPTLTVQGASVRHYRLRGGDQGGFLAPSSDMIKALEYIESLKQRADGPESPTGDYDEVDKIPLSRSSPPNRTRTTPTREDAARWPETRCPSGFDLCCGCLNKLERTPGKPASTWKRAAFLTRETPGGRRKRALLEIRELCEAAQEVPLMLRWGDRQGPQAGDWGFGRAVHPSEPRQHALYIRRAW